MFCAGLTVATLAHAFQIETSIINAVQYIKQVVVTSDGSDIWTVYMDINSNDNWEVYIKEKLAIGETGMDEQFYVSEDSFISWSTTSSLFCGKAGFCINLDTLLTGDLRNSPEYQYITMRNSRSTWLENSEITQSGTSIWIGTNFPDEKLDVHGSLQINQTNGPNTNSLTIYHSDSSVSSNDSLGKILFYNGDASVDTQLQSASLQSINTDSNGRYARFAIFTASGANEEAERLSITNDGNVGINDKTPGEKLSINGAVTIGDTSSTTPDAGTIKFSGTNFFGYNWSTRIQLDN